MTDFSWMDNREATKAEWDRVRRNNPLVYMVRFLAVQHFLIHLAQA